MPFSSCLLNKICEFKDIFSCSLPFLATTLHIISSRAADDMYVMLLLKCKRKRSAHFFFRTEQVLWQGRRRGGLFISSLKFATAACAVVVVVVVRLLGKQHCNFLVCIHELPKTNCRSWWLQPFAMDQIDVPQILGATLSLDWFCKDDIANSYKGF